MLFAAAAQTAQQVTHGMALFHDSQCCIHCALQFSQNCCFTLMRAHVNANNASDLVAVSSPATYVVHRASGLCMLRCACIQLLHSLAQLAELVASRAQRDSLAVHTEHVRQWQDH